MSLNRETFEYEMNILRHLPPKVDEETHSGRLVLMWDALEDFPGEVLVKARKAYLKSAGEIYFPNPGVLRELCLDIMESRQREKEYVKPGPIHVPLEHVCATTKPEINEALAWLARIVPYEAKHVVCDAKVAICPQCGGQHERLHAAMTGLRDLRNEKTKELEFPGQTEGWNLWAKGLYLCEMCEKEDHAKRGA